MVLLIEVKVSDQEIDLIDKSMVQGMKYTAKPLKGLQVRAMICKKLEKNGKKNKETN